ncbi:MAG: dipeptidase [Bacillota bacterium]|nr:dipeptidase [Bacillota bacterium]
MIFVDAHCDTVLKLLEEENSNLLNNNFHFDILRAKSNGNYLQFLASFIEPSYGQAYSLRRALQLIDRLYKEAEIHKDHMMLCCNYNDINKAFSVNKLAGLISIEGGEALQGEISVLRCLYKIGVRSICLTWNHRNEIADGVSDGSTGGGLSPFGREVVREMNSLGMLIDVSHLSEKGFWDVVENSEKPIIASHSNAKAICDNRRNLTDDQILAISKIGGTIGINLYPEFLNNTQDASLKDIILHIEHIASIAGNDILGLGADFDGIECTPRDITGVQDIGKIIEELYRLNYSEEFIEKFAGQNFLRVIKEVIG